jgi:hypothetical protein
MGTDPTSLTQRQVIFPRPAPNQFERSPSPCFVGVHMPPERTGHTDSPLHHPILTEKRELSAMNSELEGQCRAITTSSGVLQQDVGGGPGQAQRPREAHTGAGGRAGSRAPQQT